MASSPAEREIILAFQTTPINQANIAGAFTAVLNRSEITPKQVQRMKWVEDKVAAWNAMDDLAQETYQRERAITPTTLVKTYALFQDRLKNLMSDQNNYDLYAAMATKLKAEFTHNMPTFDFKGEQRRFSHHQRKIPQL